VEEGSDAVATPETLASCRSSLPEANRFDLSLLLESIEV
jgi:hypothetical protein